MLQVENEDKSITIFVVWEGKKPPPESYNSTRIVITRPNPLQQSVAAIHIFHNTTYGVNRVAANNLLVALGDAIQIATAWDLEAYGEDWTERRN